MAKPDAPAIRIRRYEAGRWSDSPDAVVTEEPLQLLLDGEPLSVVMRTPGQDVELALGLFYAEGIIRALSDVASVRISAEAAESEPRVSLDASIMESNHLDVRLAHAARRKPERSMLASAACGVCGAVMIEDLRRDLSVLDSSGKVDAAMLPALVERMRSGQGVFERTGRHNAVDKVAGRMLLDGRLPVGDAILVVSGRAGYEIVQKSITAGIPVVAAVGAPSSLAVALAREFHQTLVGFLRGTRFNVYSAPERLAG